VMPGSLGVESFLQLLKFLAIERWGGDSGTCWQATTGAEPHEWTYRGQIVPTNHLVELEAEVTAIDQPQHSLRADGSLSVDGRVIYVVKNFSLSPRVAA